MPVVYRKLVRDRIPEIIQSEGHRPVTRVLDDGSYRQALLAKLIEEAQEASHATADNLPGELADVLEVLRALTVTAGMSWPQLLALAEDKRSRRGGFGRRIFLESVE
jgi:predicted house-cleaning noncanonical NTP pyrophosphatase (MazG superfamily)